MTNPPDPLPFERFVGAVHRRMVLLRALERVGLCVLGACVVALVLMPILVSRGEATGGLIAAALGAACFVGLLWGVISRPSKLAAAAEVDRQLRLADLLGTALTLRRHRPADDMERAVLALADARCRQVMPSAVVLNRLGARSWGGIGLALALVMGLNLLGPDPARSANRPATDHASWLDPDAGHDPADPLAASTRAPDLRRMKAGSGADEDPDSSKTESTETSTSPPAPVASTDMNAKEPGGGGSPDGAGAGAAQSKAKPTGTAPLPVAAGNSTPPATGGSNTAGGGSGSAPDLSKPADKTGSAAGGDTPRRRPAPVWQSDGWAADREAAGNAIRGGRVPDEYRDVVRGYFQRD